MTIRNPSNGRSYPRATKWDHLAFFLLFALGFYGFNVAMFGAVIAYIPSQTVTIPYRAGVLFLASVVLSFSYLNRRGPAFQWYLIPILLFFLAYTLRIIGEGYYSGLTVSLPRPPSSMLQLLWGVCFIPMLAFARPVSERMQNWGLYGFLSTGFVVALVGTYLYRDFFLGGIGRVRTGEFVGEFVALSPLSLAYAGSALMVVGLALVAEPGSIRRQFGRRRIIGVIALALGLFPLLIGASRGALVAFVICGCILIASRLRGRQLLTTFLGLFVGVGVLVSIYFFAERFESNLVGRFLAIGTDIETGSNRAARLLIWKESLAAFIDSPFFGAGMTPELAGHPHNSIIEAFFTTGFLGGMAFLTVALVALRRAFAIVRHSPRHAWIGLLFIHYFVNSMFSNSIGSFPYFWYSFALVFGVYASLGLKSSKAKTSRLKRPFTVRRQAPVIPQPAPGTYQRVRARS